MQEGTKNHSHYALSMHCFNLLDFIAAESKGSMNLIKKKEKTITANEPKFMYNQVSI